MILIPKRKMGDIPTQQGLTIQETLRQVRGLNLDWANIKNAAIVDAQITNCSVTKLTAGNLAVTGTLTTGGYLKSTNYVADTSGWQIDYLGNAEFNNATIRGTLYTSSIASGNTLTVTGTISAAGGKVVIDFTGLTIGTTGGPTAHLIVKDSAGTQQGSIYATTSGLWIVTSPSHLYINCPTDKGIYCVGQYIRIPNASSAYISPADGMFYYDNDTNTIKVYANGFWKTLSWT